MALHLKERVFFTNFGGATCVCTEAKMPHLNRKISFLCKWEITGSDEINVVLSSYI